MNRRKAVATHHYPGIRLKRLRKTSGSLSQNSR